MPNLLLVRHGEAVEDLAGLHDGDRWLTDKGRKVTRDVARYLATHCPPATVWTSPLARAVQTAEILCNTPELPEGAPHEVRVIRPLATGDVADLVYRIAAFEGARPLVLVGHEPTLSALASHLLGEPWEHGFKKSGVLALHWAGQGKARFVWALTPKTMRVAKSRHEME